MSRQATTKTPRYEHEQHKVSYMLILIILRQIYDAPKGFLTARDLGANIARALKVSTCKQTRWLDIIARLSTEKVC